MVDYFSYIPRNKFAKPSIEYKRFSLARAAGVLLVMLLISACARTQEYASIDTLQTTGGTPKILLMPVDVELSVLTAGGLEEPNAEWTELGTANLIRAIDRQKGGLGFQLIDYEAAENSLSLFQKDQYLQLERLHGAVGNAIRVHKYLGLDLPTKEETFNWSLGPDATSLAKQFDADYALFVFARQSFSSGGRKALQAFGVLAGIYVPGGQQLGFLSLVDLKTGDIVWYNALVLDKANLREQEGADKFTSWMFEAFPAVP